jgi:membrane glycosyltransferase
VRGARLSLCAISLVLAAALIFAFWHGIDRTTSPPWVLGAALGLFSVNALWLAIGASIAIIGLCYRTNAPHSVRTSARMTPGPTAILWLICGEAPVPVAARIEELTQELDAAGLSQDCSLFILSDTQGAEARQVEARAFATLTARGAVEYRNRSRNTGHKPGNIADWMSHHGSAFETMLVMDADSAISVARLQEMRAAMADDPTLGLVQSGIRLRPGETRFTGLERLSARLCGPPFMRGFAAITGNAGNYWGHNALIRVNAFASAAGLPVLPGRAPMGGPILSHDIVEAAWLVRAGWGVRVLPNTRGSFEAGPETVTSFYRRDRRWCQGNLQHLRLIGAAGLHPMSRFHLICGVQNYLAAPVWLALVLMFASGLIEPAPGAVMTLLAVATVLLLPKAAALLHWRHRTGRARRAMRRVLRRAIGVELLVTSLVAPLVMVRQSLAVVQVALGQDCGWRPDAARLPSKNGALEVAAGAGLVALSAGAGGGFASLILLPVAGPLLVAPWLIPWLDRSPHGRTIGEGWRAGRAALTTG